MQKFLPKQDVMVYTVVVRKELLTLRTAKAVGFLLPAESIG